jgi:WS/DGAT/MGAT family acyltransferase
MTVLMSTSPDAEIPEAPPYVPRSTPSRAELLRDELVRRAGLPVAAFRDVRNFLREARDARTEILVRARGVAETLGATLRPASATPLNQPVGPHRRFDWMTLDLAELKEIRKTLGGSVNDVVLTVVTGAVRRFLAQRRVDTSEMDFRIMAPVSVRAETDRGKLGNRVSAWIVPLPVDEEDPKRQLATISAKTEELKSQRQAVAAEVLTQAAEWTPATLLSLGARNATRLLPFNMVVTNIPGPQVPLYMLGGRMKEIYPQVPLMDNLALGIALFSYDGQICWGFNADYDQVPDLERFVAAVGESFQDLRSAAGLPVGAAATKPAAATRRSRAKATKAARANGGSAPT